LKNKIPKKNAFGRMVESDRIITFRVAWIDKGATQVNRGYRIQMNSAIGPYKGRTSFSPFCKFKYFEIFAFFEQTFKNSLTTLPMGGGKVVLILILKENQIMK
jgi:glutamate dehydrogenase (NADP+)